MKKEAVCAKHIGATVHYDLDKHDGCPLCLAEEKLADYETSDS